MSHGGSRNRSGPAPDPNSARSEARGVDLRALPNEGYQGEVPPFPLGAGPDLVVMREIEIWAEAWTTPQAAAWAQDEWRWPIIAEYCRLKAIVEVNPAASAALVAQLHRYRDQIGLTPAGMRENGWAVKKVDIQPSAGARETRKEPPVRRMRG